MKRPDVVQRAAEGGFPDPAFAKQFPTLAEYLGDDRWEDGQPRDLSSIQLKVQDGMVLAVLQDHELSRGLYVVGDSVQAALKALEKHASSPTADWRAWKQYRGKKKGS